MWKRFTIGFVAAGFIIAMWSLSAGLRAGDAPEPDRADGAALGESGFGIASAAERVEFLSARIRPGDGDYVTRTLLAQAQIARPRETGDLALYEAAETTLDDALEANPSWSAARLSLAALRMGEHRFAEAFDIADEELMEDPSNPSAVAARADAALELGRYDDAEAGFVRLRDSIDGPAVRIRLARFQWVRGDADAAVDEASEALQQAIDRGVDATEVAFYATQLAGYRLDTGDLPGAIEAAEQAVELAPESSPAAAMLARVRVAQGDLEAASLLYEQSVAAVPVPEFLAALGDVYAAMGNDAAAQEQFDTVLVIGELAQANSTAYDRQLALFLADHELDTAEAVRLARAELEDRQDVYAYDTLAWALYRDGQIAEAAEVAAEIDARPPTDLRVRYHLAMIAADSGRSGRGVDLLSEVLEANPAFDPKQAPLAEATLARLQED